MATSSIKSSVNGTILEQLQACFPVDSAPDPSSPISKGMAALERRASSRSATAQNSRLVSPSQRSPTASPSTSPQRLKPTLDIDTGLRSTASSPGPPRRAPPPPLLRATMRPPSELFLPTPTSARKTGFRFSAIVPEGIAVTTAAKPATSVMMTAPSIANTAPIPLSPISAGIAHAISRIDVDNSLQNVFANLSVPEPSRFILPPIPRASTAPPSSLRRRASFLSLRSTRSLSLLSLGRRLSRAGGSSSRGAGVKPLQSPRKLFSGIDKDLSAEKRASAILAKHKSDLGAIPASPVQETAPTRPVLKKAATSVMPWRKRPRGETMSMLIESGFFPVKEFIYDAKSLSQSDSSPTKRAQRTLNILVKGFPVERPSSILMTPTRFYESSPLARRRSARGNYRRSLTIRRRILDAKSIASSQISPTAVVARTVTLPPLSPGSPTSPLTPSKALSALTGGLLAPPSPSSPNSFESPQSSPGILEVIPEDGNAAESVSTPEPPALSEPIETEIHLASGTVLTVKPPELTAWRRSIYAQGPIKLPTPAIVPRRGSVATMGPFQNLLPPPRRQSEDASIEDICAWYADWAFEEVTFAFDEFTLSEEKEVTEWALGPVIEEPESPIDRGFAFRFPSPAPPLAKEIARAMLGDKVASSSTIPTRPKLLSMAMIPLPELPKGASSANGSSKGHSRNHSGGSESSSRKSGEALSRPGSRGSGMSAVSDVEEQGWSSADGKGNRRASIEVLKAKPKMSRVRRFVQTASAIL